MGQFLNTGIITAQTELSEQAAEADQILVYDTSAAALKKVTKANFSPVLSYNTRSATGDGSTTTTVTSGTTVNDVIVLLNGVVQTPTTDYTISGTTLTFGTAPAASDKIVIRELPRWDKNYYG